ncbi:MAG TPA: NAD-dependent epimerase/dehydratase family protein, partial [Gammaproteobacteria bacterium]|nr:NAD-dependent epimerase/dehydratase family protein [Gammaproteobacteria bacterium]
MTILVTGAAGFIGAALSQYLLDRGDDVVGVDDLNHYYDVNLKKARLESLITFNRFTFNQLDISDRSIVSELFSTRKFSVVVHLAAQAGVRYSIENPSAYIDANLVGFGNILEGCRHQAIDHLVYASSSSVYGSNTKLPFSEDDVVDHPISLYAATKKANELMAHVYSHLYCLPTTGLRFFTVYGPWGRPDMALFKFTKGILDGKPIPVYNRGEMVRDFTYIDDIVEGVVRAIDRLPPLDSDHENKNDSAVSPAPYQIYNIGNSHPIPLMRYIQALEKALGKKAQLELLPMQPGDVRATEADVSRLMSDL